MREKKCAGVTMNTDELSSDKAETWTVGEAFTHRREDREV
jgi:hypothetical protein